MAKSAASNQSQGPQPGAAGTSNAAPKASTRRVTPQIPERLAALQQELVEAEVAVIIARRNRNIEVAKLRDDAKMSQYRIAKWLGVTERAVMLMAQQGRENPAD